MGIIVDLFAGGGGTSRDCTHHSKAKGDAPESPEVLAGTLRPWRTAALRGGI